MTTITTEKIEELRRVTLAATPGEWEHQRIDEDSKEWTACEIIGCGDFVSTMVCKEQDAAFIAAANPATILALLDLAQRAMVPQPQEGQVLPTVAEALKHAADLCMRATPNRAKVKSIGEAAHYAACADAIRAYTSQLALPAGQFQQCVQPWMMACFGEAISNDLQERNHRFLEEALELVQSTGCTQSEAHQLVDYVYGRPVGEPEQEVGGVMVTLAALCLAAKLDMHAAGETELARIWTKVDQIRAKQAAKPKHSPLPMALPAGPVPEIVSDLRHSAKVDGYTEAQAKFINSIADRLVSPAVAQPVADERVIGHLLPCVPELTQTVIDGQRYCFSGAKELSGHPELRAKAIKLYARAALCPPAEEGGKS